MITLPYIRENKEEAIERLAIRNIDARATIESILATDADKRKKQAELETGLAEANALAKEIGNLFKSGQSDKANELNAQTAAPKEREKVLAGELETLETAIYDLLVTLPNTPALFVPKGATPDDNVTVFEHGAIPTLHEGAKPHWELTEQYKLIDFELGNKITGAGFPVYTGKGAKLQRALINFFLDEAAKAGYEECQMPLMVNAASGFGTGQLPDKEGQMYHATVDDLYLIPTAEVPITNMYRDVIVKAEQFPIKNMGYTPCFRREAGSYGAHVRGLNRLHQFDKVEIVQLQHPDKSYDTLEEMKEHVKGLLIKLELPFRILHLCGGDMGFASACTFDFEVYSTAQQRWLECSSVSNFETFQANRLKLRFKDADGKTKLAHTLNGSALALPRIVAALLENHQTAEGIKIPAALVPYTGFDMIS
jgi:seryl-tRNA synthetase